MHCASCSALCKPHSTAPPLRRTAPTSPSAPPCAAGQVPPAACADHEEISATTSQWKEVDIRFLPKQPPFEETRCCHAGMRPACCSLCRCAAWAAVLLCLCACAADGAGPPPASERGVLCCLQGGTGVPDGRGLAPPLCAPPAGTQQAPGIAGRVCPDNRTAAHALTQHHARACAGSAAQQATRMALAHQNTPCWWEQ